MDLFAPIDVDAEWLEHVRRISTQGPVVYVLRNQSAVDFLALNSLTKRHRLPQIRFVNEVGVAGPLAGLSLGRRSEDPERLRRAILAGHSAALFLKRPANLFEPKARGRIEGDAFLRMLLSTQRELGTPIQLCPQVFVWSQQPGNAKAGPLDIVLGPREWPGNLRTLAQFAFNYRNVSLRAGEPLDLQVFLQRGTGDLRETDEALLRRLTYLLLRRIERERRAITGPLRKPVDRVRSEVIRSPKLQRWLGEVASDEAPARALLTNKVEAMLREMEAAPDPAVLPVLDGLFERTVGRMFSEIVIDQAGLARLREASKDGALVLLPNHRSHLDYIVLAKLFRDAKMPMPLVAAGNNLNFFPAGPILRKAGAFYIRRSFRGDRLYATVLEAYVRRLIREGQPLEFFLEGGRSRTGRLLPPQRGLLSMVVDAAVGGGKPVFFCPIAITYERVPEERAYVRELTGASKEREDLGSLLRSARVLGQHYGRVCVDFAPPLALNELLGDHEPLTPKSQRALVTALAKRTLREIAEVSTITPGAVVATVLLAEPGRAIAHDDLQRRSLQLASDLRACGARLATAFERPAPVLGALRLFFAAGHLEALRAGAPLGTKQRSIEPGPEALYRVPDEARLALDLAKGSVVPRLITLGLLATVELTAGAEITSDEQRLERCCALAKLIEHEFPDREPLDAAQLERSSRQLGGGPARLERRWLYARILEPFVESVLVAARTLAALRPSARSSTAELAKRALALGDRMHAKREIHRREAVTRPSFEGAFRTFVKLGFLVPAEGSPRAGRALGAKKLDRSLRIAESFAQPELRRTLEQRIAIFRLPATNTLPQ